MHTPSLSGLTEGVNASDVTAFGRLLMETDLDRIPVDVIFHARWWHENHGIIFDEGFFLDPCRRVEDERRMRAALYDRFGDLGLGEKDAKPRPVIGPVLLATGHVLPTLFGCDVVFREDTGAEVVALSLSAEEVMALELPDLAKHPIWQAHMAMMDALEEEFGYLEGDIPVHGVINAALDIRGVDFLIDLLENPTLVDHLGWLIAQTSAAMASTLRQRTGSSSISINRIIAHIDPSIHIVPNCSLQMISPKTYEERLLKFDHYLVQELAPGGFHHCGSNGHLHAPVYAKANPVYMDVGWGSDVAAVRRALPDAWLSLRLGPVKLLTCSVQEVYEDVWRLLDAAGGARRAAIVCVNMDYGTPDENVRAIFQAVEAYKKERLRLQA